MKRNSRRPQQPPPPPPSFHPPPTPSFSTTSHHRDSDASFTSNHPSSSFNLRHSQQPLLSDQSSKQAAIRAINSYFSSNNFPANLSLKALPSAKDLGEILKFLLSRLGYVVDASSKVEDELYIVLKSVNCPITVNKSTFRAPGAPHSVALILSVLHWLVQLADFNDHLRQDENINRFRTDPIMAYTMDSYVAFMKVDDETIEALDMDLTEKMEKEASLTMENMNSMDEEGKRLEAELNALKTMPSERETFESQRKDLEADLDKFQGFVASLQDANSVTLRALDEKEKELTAKVEEIKRTKAENEELKKRAEAQGINIRDAERMKRELLAVEREISEAEASRSSWEEKCWDLDSVIGQKFKELEALSIECNQALRRLKLGGDFQYLLNAKGTTPAAVLGIDYKSTLKPAINALADDIKKNTTAKFEEFIALQQLSKDMTAKIEAKRNRLAVLQSHIDDAERQLEVIRTKTNEYSLQCINEAEKIIGDVEAEAGKIVVAESEALDSLKAAELKLQEETRQSEEETQRCAYEVFALIDSVSRYKEHVENKITEMRNDLSETTEYISTAYKNTLSSHLNITPTTANLPLSDC